MAHVTMAMVGGWVAVTVSHLPVVVALVPALGVTVSETGGHGGGRLMGWLRIKVAELNNQPVKILMAPHWWVCPCDAPVVGPGHVARGCAMLVG